MVSVASKLKYTVKKSLKFFDFKEKIEIYKLRKRGNLLSYEELIPYFKGSSLFAFGTGGSLANLQGLERLSNKNIFMMTTGIVHFYRMYGIVPNIWYVHNPDSVLMTMHAIEKYHLKDKISFKNTFILLPSNRSSSKNVHFSSKVFKKFRKYIDNEACFVLYEENYRPFTVENCPEHYLKEGHRPIEFIEGSSVENSFLPFLGFMGVQSIYFSGVDHMNHTGHFWDRKEAYQTINGKRLSFQAIKSDALIHQSSVLALKKAEERNIQIFRLEKTETILQAYPLIDFEFAIENTSPLILPKDVQINVGYNKV